LAARYYASGYVSAALECLKLCYKSVWRWGRVVDVGKLARVCFRIVVGRLAGVCSQVVVLPNAPLVLYVLAANETGSVASLAEACGKIVALVAVVALVSLPPAVRVVYIVPDAGVVSVLAIHPYLAGRTKVSAAPECITP
jgi:hypothetical protein